MEDICWLRDDVSLGGNSKGEIRPCLSIRMDKTVLSFQISFFRSGFLLQCSRKAKLQVMKSVDKKTLNLKISGQHSKRPLGGMISEP